MVEELIYGGRLTGAVTSEHLRLFCNLLRFGSPRSTRFTHIGEAIIPWSRSNFGKSNVSPLFLSTINQYKLISAKIIQLSLADYTAKTWKTYLDSANIVPHVIKVIEGILRIHVYVHIG